MQKIDDHIKEYATDLFEASVFRKLVCSNNKKHEFQKIEVVLKQEQSYFYQVCLYKNKQVFHKNVCNIQDLLDYLFEVGCFIFTQLDFISVNGTTKFLVKKTGEFKVLKNKNNSLTNVTSHNRKKESYFIEEVHINFLEELGIMDQYGKVFSKKQSKFRQINKFIEFVESISKSLPKEPVIIDFGCGKAYMTFALYHYLINNGFNPTIIGIDLKADVVRNCDRLAKKIGFNGLEFIVADIFKYKADKKIDMVVSLHACDIATDYCLYGAIKNNAEVILSVPCCQKEINQQLKDKQHYMLKHGFLKNQFSSLLTDALRGLILEDFGYDVTICEFISSKETPKNTLIKATKNSKKTTGLMEVEVIGILEKYQIKNKLYDLTKEL